MRRTPVRHQPPRCAAQRGSLQRSRPLTSSDALSFLRTVRERTRDTPSVYADFLEVMVRFRNERCVAGRRSRSLGVLCAERRDSLP